MQKDIMKIYVKLGTVSYDGETIVNLFDVKTDSDIRNTFEKLTYFFRDDYIRDSISDEPTWYVLDFKEYNEYKIIECDELPEEVHGRLLTQMKMCADNLVNVANYLSNSYRNVSYDTRDLIMKNVEKHLSILSRYLEKIDYVEREDSHFIDINAMLTSYPIEYTEKMFSQYCRILIYFLNMKLHNYEYARYGVGEELYPCLMAAIQNLDRALLL